MRHKNYLTRLSCIRYRNYNKAPGAGRVPGILLSLYHKRNNKKKEKNMFACNALLLKDFYKAVHSEMLDPGMTKSVSYFTPRTSRNDRWDGVVNFGLQAF